MPLTNAKLMREYRCQSCGGRLVERAPIATNPQWHITCGRCGGSDFIHEREWQRQRSEALEVLDGLPPELAAAMGHEMLACKPGEIFSSCPDCIEI